jgi:general secretion pathway protein D
MELETALKYAKAALQDRHYDAAVKLLTAILVQDPSDREAQTLMERAQLAKLDEERDRTTVEVRRGEEAMVNEVLKAQVLPETRQAPIGNARLLAGGASPLAAKLQEPVSFEFSDVALSDVLEFLADAASVSIIPSPQLDLKTQRVSLKVKQLPLGHAIKYLAKSLSLAYRVEQDAILIATPEEFSNEPLQTRVFFLHSGLGPFALETAALSPNPALAMESIKDLMERTIPQPPDSKFIVDERSGALIVTNTTENLQLVERLLGQLDVTPVQVLIEARFVEVTMTDLEQLGLEAVLTGDYALSKKEAAGGGRAQGNIIGKGGGLKFPDLSRQDEGANLTIEGVLSALQFEAVLHLLEETKKSKTLSAPRVTTLNNQTAQIRVVEEFNYPTRYEVSLIQFDINGDGDFDDAGETEFANVPQDLQKRDVGILLNVTPSVGKDLKTITLVLAPEVSQFSQFRSLGGGVTVPEFTSSQVTTSVVIEDGQTVILGGLMKDTTSSQVTKVPVLGDLPLVGGLFRQREESSTRKNLLIFITARLLAPRGQTT